MMQSHVNNTAITPNGEIVWPVEGTVRWHQGKALGVWGKDFKVIPMLITSQGQVRELNALGKILFANQIAGLHP